MSRKNRIFVPSGIYHVYCRVTRGEMVFGDEALAEHWVATVGEIAKLHQLTILAWCLLSNHYHLVARSASAPLWRALARIQNRVAKNHNRRREVRGRLWQSRYQAKIVLDDHYFEQLIAYVHLNPVAAGIVDDPASYRWSGHRALIGIADPVLVNVQEALVSFGQELTSARLTYLERVRTVAEMRWLNLGVRHLPWWRQVSDNEQTIEENQAPRNATTFDEKALPERLSQPLQLPVLLRWFEQVIEVPRGTLAARTQKTGDAQARRMFTLLAVENLQHSSKCVATLLKKSPSSVSRWLAEALVLRDKDKTFADWHSCLIQMLPSIRVEE